MTGRCEKSMIDCLGKDKVAGIFSQTPSIRNLNIILNKRHLQTTKPENACPPDSPYSCSDGSCRKKRSHCPSIDSCNIFQFRCPNGLCSYDNADCNQNQVTCAPGKVISEDGLCREKKPNYDGCSLDKPFLCTNGQCVNNKLECIGISRCDQPETPFRCMDGTCVNDKNLCPGMYRSYGANYQSISFNTLTPLDVKFSYDNNNHVIGRLFIPGNSVKLNNTIYTKVLVGHAYHSVLQNVKYNHTLYNMFNVSNGIPASEGNLTFENSVMSSVFTISIDDGINTTLTKPATIFLEHNFYSKRQFKTSDYCLAILKNNEWICVNRKTREDQKIFSFSEFGTYAIVINPLRFKTLSDSNISSFLLNNLKIILIIVGSLIVVSVVMFYVFSRFLRYRQKYKEHKSKIVNLQNQLEDYKNMSTDVLGQTLGDNMAGIIYTKNPSHQISECVENNNELENDIEETQRKCKILEIQNKQVEERINDLNEQYRTVKNEIDM